MSQRQRDKTEARRVKNSASPGLKVWRVQAPGPAAPTWTSQYPDARVDRTDLVLVLVLVPVVLVLVPVPVPVLVPVSVPVLVAVPCDPLRCDRVSLVCDTVSRVCDSNSLYTIVPVASV